AVTFGALTFQWARRWSRFCLEVRFLGTPTLRLRSSGPGAFYTPWPLEIKERRLDLQVAQGVPAGIGDPCVAGAGFEVAVLPAYRAQALAVRAAERPHGHRQQDLLADGRPEVHLLARIGHLVALGGVKGGRHLGRLVLVGVGPDQVLEAVLPH